MENLRVAWSPGTGRLYGKYMGRWFPPVANPETDRTGVELPPDALPALWRRRIEHVAQGIYEYYCGSAVDSP